MRERLQCDRKDGRLRARLHDNQRRNRRGGCVATWSRRGSGCSAARGSNVRRSGRLRASSLLHVEQLPSSRRFHQELQRRPHHRGDVLPASGRYCRHQRQRRAIRALLDSTLRCQPSRGAAAPRTAVLALAARRRTRRARRCRGEALRQTSRVSARRLQCARRRRRPNTTPVERAAGHSSDGRRQSSTPRHALNRPPRRPWRRARRARTSRATEA